jgi:hypothetical protein
MTGAVHAYGLQSGGKKKKAKKVRVTIECNGMRAIKIVRSSMTFSSKMVEKVTVVDDMRVTRTDESIAMVWKKLALTTAVKKIHTAESSFPFVSCLWCSYREAPEKRER